MHMSLPKTSTSYPPQFLQAVDAAFSSGEIVILHAKPAALRLQFQGLRGALRAEGKSEIIDAVGFYIQKSPPALILRAKDQSSDARAISDALKGFSPQPKQPNNPLIDPSRPALFDVDSALDRILNRSADNA